MHFSNYLYVYGTSYIYQPNLGAKEYNRAKKGAVFGIITGVAVAELIGIGFYIGIEPLLRFFVDEEQSVSYGEMHAHVTTLFSACLLSHIVQQVFFEAVENQSFLWQQCSPSGVDLESSM